MLTLVRNLVTGSVSPELDELLAEGKQPSGSYETQEIAAVRNRCRVAQISLFEGPLSEFGVSNKRSLYQSCEPCRAGTGILAWKS